MFLNPQPSTLTPESRTAFVLTRGVGPASRLHARERVRKRERERERKKERAEERERERERERVSKREREYRTSSSTIHHRSARAACLLPPPAAPFMIPLTLSAVLPTRLMPHSCLCCTPHLNSRARALNPCTPFAPPSATPELET